MRWGVLLAGLGSLWWVSAVGAQTAPQRVQQRIMVPEVEVRSGPSLSYYPTSKLRQNEPVVVLGPASQDPRWLRIEPPRGSFSWIEERYVKREGAYAYVTEGDEVPILVGSALVDKKPTVEGAKVKKGTLLVVVGEPLSDGTSRWLPIQPTEQEVRYLPAEAVAGSESIPLPPKGAPTTAAAGASVAQASPASDVRSLIQQADNAYRARDYATASRLYEAAARTPQSSYADKAYCYAQLAQLSQQPVTATQPAAATVTQTLSPTAAPLSTSSNATRSISSSPPAGQWSPWGRLRKTAISKEGHPVYVLEDARGHPLIYAVAYPGMTLDPHVGKLLTLYGTVEYWGDQYMRTNLMTVSQVAIQPGS